MMAGAVMAAVCVGAERGSTLRGPPRLFLDIVTGALATAQRSWSCGPLTAAGRAGAGGWDLARIRLAPLRRRWPKRRSVHAMKFISWLGNFRAALP